MSNVDGTRRNFRETYLLPNDSTLSTCCYAKRSDGNVTSCRIRVFKTCSIGPRSKLKPSTPNVGKAYMHAYEARLGRLACSWSEETFGTVGLVEVSSNELGQLKSHPPHISYTHTLPFTCAIHVVFPLSVFSYAREIEVFIRTTPNFSTSQTARWRLGSAG